MSPQHPGEPAHDDPDREAVWVAARKRLARETMGTAATKTARELAFDLEQHAGTFADMAGDVVEHEGAEADLQAEADLIEAAERLRLIFNALEGLPDEWKVETLPDFVDDIARIIYGNGKKGGSK